MSQARRWLPRRRPARVRPLATLLRSSPEHLRPSTSCFKDIQAFFFLNLQEKKGSGADCSAALATWFINPPERLLCARPFTWSFLFTVKLFRSLQPPGMVLSAQENVSEAPHSMLGPLEQRGIGMSFGAEGHQ